MTDQKGIDAETARREIHAALKKALFDYERHQFNTVVSGCMTMVNVLYKLDRTADTSKAILLEGLSIVLRLLAPIAPHIAHQLWRDLGLGEDILQTNWPQVDEDALRQDNVEYVDREFRIHRGMLRHVADSGPGPKR